VASETSDHFNLVLLVSSRKKFSTNTSSLERTEDTPTGRTITNRPSGAASKKTFTRVYAVALAELALEAVAIGQGGAQMRRTRSRFRLEGSPMRDL